MTTNLIIVILVIQAATFLQWHTAGSLEDKPWFTEAATYARTSTVGGRLLTGRDTSWTTVYVLCIRRAWVWTAQRQRNWLNGIYKGISVWEWKKYNEINSSWIHNYWKGHVILGGLVVGLAVVGLGVVGLGVVGLGVVGTGVVGLFYYFKKEEEEDLKWNHPYYIIIKKEGVIWGILIHLLKHFLFWFSVCHSITTCSMMSINLPVGKQPRSPSWSLHSCIGGHSEAIQVTKGASHLHFSLQSST